MVDYYDLLHQFIKYNYIGPIVLNRSICDERGVLIYSYISIFKYFCWYTLFCAFYRPDLCGLVIYFSHVIAADTVFYWSHHWTGRNDSLSCLFTFSTSISLDVLAYNIFLVRSSRDNLIFYCSHSAFSFSKNVTSYKVRYWFFFIDIFPFYGRWIPSVEGFTSPFIR